MDEDVLSDDARRNALLRALPSIDQLLAEPELGSLLAEHPRQRRVTALRMAVDNARGRLVRGEGRGFETNDVRLALAELTTPVLRRVLNATGIPLHTNLGRAPLARAAVDRVAHIAAGYSNLEYDLEEGERGSRYAPVVDLLRGLTGAEDAVVVNNNAAAVLLVLSALSQGREAIVSRGELVEIGGGFRIPDVMRQSGARLVEVGTTNRTRLSDYEAALSSETALLVKIHKSNFAQVGFTEEVGIEALAQLGKRRAVAVFEDLGAGSLVPLHGVGLTDEPTAKESIQAGASVISFSGDKLLGGPQAGIIIGTREGVAKIRRHPLNRAVRVDKMTVAALEATLELYRDGRLDEIPALRLLTQTEAMLKSRAERLCALLRESASDEFEVVAVEGEVGGGAMPLATLRSFACALHTSRHAEFQERLRRTEPPVIARVSDGRLLLDVRCLTEEDLPVVANVVGPIT